MPGFSEAECNRPIAMPYEIEIRLALRHKNAATVTLVMAELMLAATFCKVGITAEVEVRASRNLHLARTAFDQAARLAQTVKMTKAERKRFTARHSQAKLLHRFADQPVS
jgi:hypothetical protein